MPLATLKKKVIKRPHAHKKCEEKRQLSSYTPNVIIYTASHERALRGYKSGEGGSYAIISYI